MIGLVLVAHGNLAAEFASALNHVLGAQEAVAVVNVTAGMSPEDCRVAVRAAIAAVDSGQGVLLLTDMLGGTPGNAAQACHEPGRVEVLAGLNLPMLIKCASVRHDRGLQALQDCAISAGRKYILTPQESGDD